MFFGRAQNNFYAWLLNVLSYHYVLERWLIRMFLQNGAWLAINSRYSFKIIIT